MKLYAIIIAAFLSTPTFAAEVSIEMLNKDVNGNKMVYSQEVAKVEVGDTVTWLPASKGHNVEIISSPNKMKFKSKNSKEAKITFDTPGIYYYWCTPHKGMGMIGLVVVGNDLSNIDDIASAKAIGKSKKEIEDSSCQPEVVPSDPLLLPCLTFRGASTNMKNKTTTDPLAPFLKS
jgi:pseudoazurin